MDENGDSAPLYTAERSDDGPESWRVVGPNGLVGVYQSASDAQARADYLNEQVAEETEDDA
jgi:hypothetical protein